MNGLGATKKELQVLLTLKDKASLKLKAFQGNFESAVTKITKGAALAGAAMAVGIGVKSVKSAIEFEKAMANVATLVDTTTESMSDMGKKVREISKRVPVDTMDLTSALYQVRSAGISASDAMSVLESSAELAVAGLGTTEEATDLLTSAFNTFSSQGLESNEIAKILFQTVKAGKTTVSELAQSFGMVAPIVAELNVDFAQFQAATAALTTTGLKASVAQNQIRSALVSLLKPSKDMSDLFAEIGVSSGRELIETSGDIVEVFRRLKEATGGNEEMLAKAIGRVEGLNTVLALTNNDIGPKYEETLKEMMEDSNELTEAVNKQKEATWAQYQLLKNEFNDVMIDLGTVVLPPLIDAFKKVSEWITEGKEGLQLFAQAWSGEFISSLTAPEVQAMQQQIYTLKIFFEELWSNINKVISALRSFYSTATTVSTFGLNKVIGAAWEKLSGSLGFAEGGIVPGPVGAPVPAIVHGGETIIPVGKSAGGIVININGGVYLDEDSAEKIGDKIIQKLRSNIRF